MHSEVAPAEFLLTVRNTVLEPEYEYDEQDVMPIITTFSVRRHASAFLLASLLLPCILCLHAVPYH